MNNLIHTKTKKKCILFQTMCIFDHAKRSFHRPINAIFGKVKRIASEEVVLHLVHSKCLLILLYGLEVYPLKKN